MVARKSRKPTKKVKTLPAKSVNAKHAKGVKGGGVSHADLNVQKSYDKSSANLFR